MAPPTYRPPGIRLIVAYKLVRGVVALALAFALAAAALSDGGTWLRGLAAMLREHFMGVWSVRLADLLVRVSSRRTLEIGAAALLVDGLFTIFEAWALRRQFAWAPWLVVMATASLLPFELYELYRGIHVGRLALFFANAAVVVYLVQRKVAERRSNAVLS